MQRLFNVLKYSSVTLILVVWFPLQFAVVSDLLQLALAVVVTGYLIAVVLLGLTAASERFGVKLAVHLNRWFMVIAPIAIAPPIHVYLGLETYWYDIYYYCNECGWTQFLGLLLQGPRESLLAFHLVQIGAAAAALYVILLISSFFIKIMHGRS